MSRKRDFYEVLGVSRNANADEIRKAYRALARKWHPDVNKEPEAGARFNEATEAYDVLGDPEKRKAYDRFGAAGVGAGAAGAARGGPAGSAGFDVGDLGSLFDEMFGGQASPFGHAGARGAPFGARGPRPVRGADVEHAISVTFMTAARGGSERVRLNIGGSVRTIDVKIPPAIEPGAKLRLRGRGQPGSEGAPDGDLIITVEVGGHPLFRRDGLDLVVDVPITIAEAALGANVRVPLLEGSAEIRIPPGTGSGTKLRLRGKGLGNASGRTGDYFAVVQIAAPGRLSERARAALDTLAGELQNPRETGPWADGADEAGA